MVVNIVCAALGILVGAVIVIVYACCKLSGGISRKVEKWAKDE